MKRDSEHYVHPNNACRFLISTNLTVTKSTRILAQLLPEHEFRAIDHLRGDEILALTVRTIYWAGAQAAIWKDMFQDHHPFHSLDDIIQSAKQGRSYHFNALYAYGGDKVMRSHINSCAHLHVSRCYAGSYNELTHNYVRLKNGAKIHFSTNSNQQQRS